MFAALVTKFCPVIILECAATLFTSLNLIHSGSQLCCFLFLSCWEEVKNIEVRTTALDC